jgi:NADH/NAD ratio-sensing transcriptional regulator Rex
VNIAVCADLIDAGFDVDVADGVRQHLVTRFQSFAEPQQLDIAVFAVQCVHAQQLCHLMAQTAYSGKLNVSVAHLHTTSNLATCDVNDFQ